MPWKHRSQQQAAPSWGPKSVTKDRVWGLVARPSKANKQARWFRSCTSCCCYMGHTWAPYLVIHPVIPLLHFLLLWHGLHMTQFTCFNVHTWEGGHSQYTETRYLMVIIPEVPNVISGTEIIDFFFFFRKWLWGQEYLLQFPWLSLILHIFLTENKSKKEQLQCRTVKQHQRTM